MSRFILVLCMALGGLSIHAQNSKKNQEEFDAFRSELYDDFLSFRAEIMRDYIEFVRDPWKEFESVEPVLMPEVDPVPPLLFPNIDTTIVKGSPILIDKVIDPLPINPQPQPIEAIPENDDEEQVAVEVVFYGTTLKVRYNENGKFQIIHVSEENIAKALMVLATEQYDNLLSDCIQIREEYQFCDWAYLQFIKTVADKCCGNGSNESSLLCAYVLIQSGYKIRLAFSGERLYVLFACDHTIFNQCSYSLDGVCYYGMENLPSRLHISNASFPKEKSLSLLIAKQPRFDRDLSPKRILSSESYPNFRVETQVNKNLLSFYETYPCSYYDDNYMTQWAQYANTPMDPQIIASVYPILRTMLKGLSEKEQVSRLLNFVQTGFTYDFDDKVWGYDRTFFSEETLFYPFCDCEDRSVLLTRLVRDLIGLECILVYYPGHLATAINFSSPVCGDFLEIKGKRYVICDPTYIGAPVGMSMPDTKGDKVGVIVLDAQ